MSEQTPDKKKKPKPRRKAPGQVKEVSKGKWRIRFSMGIDKATGKRKVYTETYAAENKGQAEKRLRELLRRIEAGEPLKLKVEEFSTFLDEWLATKKQSVTEVTYRGYSDLLRLYIKPTLGSLVLARIEADDIQRAYNRLREKQELVAGSFKKIHSILGMVFKLAVARKKLRGSPMLGVVIPKDQDGEEKPKALSAEQVARFLEAAKGQRFERLFKLAFHVGCRPGELLGLKWDDLGKDSIRINQTIVWRKSGDWYTKRPKTKLSRRTIALTSGLMRVLKDEQVAQYECRMRLGSLWPDHGFIFTDPWGEPWKQWQLRWDFEQVCKKAGLPVDFVPYSMRHTMASLLIDAGTNVKAVSERMGHSNIKITLETYTHPSAVAHDEVSEDIERLLRDGEKAAIRHTGNTKDGTNE